MNGLIEFKQGNEKKLNCGDCNLCCKLPHIPKTYFKDTTFEKKSFEWCKHCDISSGCKVYKDSPQTSKNFEIMYLIGMQLNRPNKLGFLAIPEDVDGLNYVESKVMTLYCEPHKLSNIIKNIHKEHNFNFLANEGWSFVIRTNKNDKDLWVYDPKKSDELIRPSEKLVDETRQQWRKNANREEYTNTAKR